ncbi:ATP-dependent Clp protease ATP-binding subunit ClpX [Kibdelosporangium banguiense]|uniref:ATP-dependent Clp protease ATP-binding subunit ClpX n=1 Tax=Kibdelosporangium banguiense TaxID=1365924 RepID=A0ABS4TLG6_9PSEU|nr:ClpX C4-type zinc finger protein [Kibdelosporangium banguiense]MBP2325277.1 ATP-dependent Clp protease ATP-binding subunit ClpX [Kibdelosporangium banguiense]
MTTRTLLACSFCGRPQTEVAQLVAGPGVFICDGCVELANTVIAEAKKQKQEQGEQPPLPEV